jgi:hypothetical protein
MGILPPIILGVTTIAFVAFWRLPGALAKVVFTIMSIFLGLYGLVGAWHAWGESQSIPWAAGWLTFTVVFFGLAALRFRRP